MDKHKKDLYVFGYGLALLIPSLVLVHAVDIQSPALGVVALLATFVAVMVVITKLANVTPIYNIWILVLQAYVLRLKLNDDTGAVGIGLLVLSVCACLVTIINVNALKRFYDGWMKVAHFIGECISTILLSVIFYTVFLVSAIIIKILRKDLLHRGLDPECETYWINKHEKRDFKTRYTNQF